MSSQVSRCREPAHLIRCELPRPARAELPEAHPADAHADQPDDRGIDRPEHAPELTLPALRQGRPVPDEAGIRPRIERRDELARLLNRRRAEGRGEPGEAFIEADPATQDVEMVLAEGSGKGDRVFTLDTEGRGEDPVRPG